MTKVSIIMPSLNVAEYIEECLLSALNQTMADIEIICIDAGSSDGTWEILQKYASDERYSSIIRLIHSDIKSYGYQVNMGIRKANGEYVAILETDDYVEHDMYESLYKIAIKNDADVVKADYDCLKTYKNGARKYARAKLWSGGAGSSNSYNKVISAQNEPYLYANDYNLWKGIYKKSFLINNGIWLNETPGAAYQDIGFLQQVIGCAERAYYTDESYYRYRLDRELSSTNSMRGLQYIYQEFNYILENAGRLAKVKSSAGFYWRMAMTFVCEYTRTLPTVDFDCESERIKKYFEWFKSVLTKALDEHILPLEKMGDYYVNSLNRILFDNAGYIEELKAQYFLRKHKEEVILSSCNGKAVYVFGAGNYGKCAVEFLMDYDIVPCALFDNNAELWGSTIYGLPVYAPGEINKLANVDGAVFMIANKLHRDEIKEQLLNMGISEDKLFFWNVL